jgi:Kef-type K+ transport system membrane component KefB
MFLLAMLVIFTLPYLFWRVTGIDYYAPLVVVQIIMGIVMGPGILGAHYPAVFGMIFSPSVILTLSGIATWAVMIFVMLAGIELDLRELWAYKRESAITAGFALGTPLIFGAATALILLALHDGWIGPGGNIAQFVTGIGMACAVTALPILILLMDKLALLRTPLGHRVMRYASLDDIAIWGVLAVILLDWNRVGKQLLFLVGYVVVSFLFRKLMRKLQASDRWYVALVWLATCGYLADWSGLHFMVGAFMAGLVIDAAWFDQADLDKLRHVVLMVFMPVFFLSTGLKTNWQMGGIAVFVAAGLLLLASVGGKLAGVHLAGKVLKWKKGEASIIGWLLQTKALIMIIFCNVLLDKGIISHSSFTALLLMAIGSTMITVPMVAPRLRRQDDKLH